jgi:hypothetical protein
VRVAWGGKYEFSLHALAVGDGDARPPAAQGEGGQLLASGKDLTHEVGAVAAGRDEGAEEQQKDLEHGLMRMSS